MGKSNYLYNLTKKERSNRLLKILWRLDQDSEEEVRIIYDAELKEIKTEQKWSDDDIIVFPDDEHDEIFMVLQKPDHLELKRKVYIYDKNTDRELDVIDTRFA